LTYRLDFSLRHCYTGPETSITVPAILKRGDEEVDLIASVDTGASHCLFQRSYAEALGLDVESGQAQSFTTANSRFQAYGHELTISVLSIEIHSTAFFFADPLILKNVLGRQGWLDRIRLGLVDHDQILYISPYDPSDS
jgi:hypothetical protein